MHAAKLYVDFVQDCEWHWHNIVNRLRCFAQLTYVPAHKETIQTMERATCIAIDHFCAMQREMSGQFVHVIG